MHFEANGNKFNIDFVRIGMNGIEIPFEYLIVTALYCGIMLCRIVQARL
jgi:hypothetical protein